ncbi:hypothetical protein [Methyloceanibacter caenitepidi]|uniref:hypothetical protein n=1 Tax=Methyloceanibacter caenitepidi TaxID=1384459 RepID=UPI001ABB4331|nr:hypothetical protein [Methyloceanibacter caenitepidi]
MSTVLYLPPRQIPTLGCRQNGIFEIIHQDARFALIDALVPVALARTWAEEFRLAPKKR